MRIVRRLERMLSTTKAGSSMSRVKVEGFFTSSDRGTGERPGERPGTCFPAARGRTGVGGKRNAEVVITMSEMSACSSAGGVKSWLDLEWRREDVGGGGGANGTAVGVGVVGRERELALLITPCLYWSITVRFLFLFVEGGERSGGAVSEVGR